MTLYHITEQEEVEDLKVILKRNLLPCDDIQLEGNYFAFYRTELGSIVGSGGLEFHGHYGLLRSVAVASELRKKGHGEKIVTDLIARARERSVWSIWLLTETAQSFFKNLGFENKSREDAPKEIKYSSEYSTVCPASAELMSLTVSNPAGD